ncbi:TnpV protein [Lachnospiraceae bacterium 54-11]
MELTYHWEGDYLIPDLTAGEKQGPIGKYGMLRKRFLKENRAGWYQGLMLSGKLDRHLAEVEKSAMERMEVLVEGLLEKYPAPDKGKDQLAWAAHMNSLGAMAEESVLQELVYS